MLTLRTRKKSFRQELKKNVSVASSRSPEWRQRNAIADLSSDNAETKAAAATAWAQVTALRTKSNEIEASILSMSDSEIIAFDATDDTHWE